MANSRSDYRRVRKLIEYFQSTLEVIRVDRKRVVVEARNKLKLRRLDHPVSATTRTNMLLAANNAHTRKCLADRVLTSDLIAVGVAVTLRAALIVTWQVPVPEQPSPLQPVQGLEGHHPRQITGDPEEDERVSRSVHTLSG